MPQAKLMACKSGPEYKAEMVTTSCWEMAANCCRAFDAVMSSMQVGRIRAGAVQHSAAFSSGRRRALSST